MTAKERLDMDIEGVYNDENLLPGQQDDIIQELHQYYEEEIARELLIQKINKLIRNIHQ